MTPETETQTTTDAPQAKPHGKVSTYQGGCRCETCRAGWATYHRNYKRAKGVMSKAEFTAAKRMGLTRRRSESAADYARRMAEMHPVAPRTEAYYEGDRVDALTLRPTLLGRRILEAVSARTGRDPSDIVEHLLRSCASRVAFDEPPTLAG